MRRFFIYAISLLGCGRPDDSVVLYSDGRQMLTLNEIDEAGKKITRPTVKMISPDSIAVGDEFVAKIFLLDSDEDFVVAFTDCASADSLSIDTASFHINACRSKLFSQGDTVFLAFKPQSPGTKTFQPIKIVTRDKHRIFRTLDYSFDYKVVDN